MMMKVFTLAAVVAAFDSCTAAHAQGFAAQAQGFACSSRGWLLDPSCRLDDISRVFGGALAGCIYTNDVIYAYESSDCYATVRAINNHPDYDGPPIKCVSTSLTYSCLLLLRCVR